MLNIRDSNGDLWSIRPEKIIATHWGCDVGHGEGSCSKIYLEGGILIQIYASDEYNRKGLSIIFGSDWPIPLHNNQIDRNQIDRKQNDNNR